jgi:tRNA(adenine34) deaminase
MALDEAAKGKAEGNMAVGSLIVRGETVVSRGRNLVTSTFDPTAHAETVALREAGRALQRVEFPGCALYTTFEPCPMCCGAILASGISTLVMGGRPAPAERRWGDYTVERLIELSKRGDSIQVVTGILTQACVDIRQGEGGR